MGRVCTELASTRSHGDDSISVHTWLSTPPISLVRGTIAHSSCGPLAQGEREGLECGSHLTSQGSPVPEEPGRHTEIQSSWAEGLTLHQGHPAPATLQKVKSTLHCSFPHNQTSKSGHIRVTVTPEL